jgi:WD40 repeat protein
MLHRSLKSIFRLMINCNYSRLLAAALAALFLPALAGAQPSPKLEIAGQGSYSDPVNIVAFSPDRKTIATAGSDKNVATMVFTNSIKLWDAGSGRHLRSIEEKNQQIKSIAFSSDGKSLLSLGTSNFNATIGKLKIWDVDSGRLVHAFEEDIPAIYSAPLSPNGNVLASINLTGGFSLWDLSNVRKTRVLSPLKTQISFEGIGSSQFITFSPDGKLFAAVFMLSGKVSVWDVNTGKLVRELAVPSVAFGGSVAFSNDGKLLATAGTADMTQGLRGIGKPSIKLWDLSTGEDIRTLEGHTGQITSFTFSPDGKMLASIGADKTINLWNTSNGQLIHSMEGHNSPSQSLCFSPDGKLLVSAGGATLGYRMPSDGDKTLKLWDPNTGQLVRTFEGGGADSGGSSMVKSVALSPDGKMLAVAQNDKIFGLWELSSGRLIRSFEGHTGTVNSVAFSRDGKFLATGSEDKTLKLWDANTGRLVRSFEGQDTPIGAIAISPDGKFLASGGDDSKSTSSAANTIDTQSTMNDILKMTAATGISGGMPNSTGTGRRSAGDAGRGAGTPDKGGAGVKPSTTASDGGVIRLWDKDTGQLVRSFDERGFPVSFVAFSPDGKSLVSASFSNINIMASNNKIKFWDVNTGKLIRSFNGIKPIAFSPDWKRMVYVGSDYRLQLMNVDTEGKIQHFKGQTGLISAAAFSPDGKTLAVGISDKSLRLWDIETGDFLRSFEGSAGVINTIAYSPDGGLLVTGGLDSGTKLWSANTGNLKGTLLQFGSGDWIAFTPDNYYNSSEGAGRYISWRVGEQVYNESQFKARFNKPHLVATAIRSEKPAATIPGDLSTKVTPGKYYALVIGINEYEQLGGLSTPTDDAKQVAAVLSERYGFETRLLLNANATREKILTAINEYRDIFDNQNSIENRNSIAQNDHLLIYYAGHGKFDNTAAKKGYWQPSDAHKTRYDTWISSDDLTASINRIQAQHIMIVSDSCYSGTMRETVTAPENRDDNLKKMREGISRTLMSSGSNEPVADQIAGTSVFASAFLRGLNQMDHPVFTAKELFLKYIKDSMTGKFEQTPQYNPLSKSTHGGGDFIFERKN